MGIIEKLGSLFSSKDEGMPQVLPGRNEPCWCGSNKKYKKCHESEDQKKRANACSINCGPT
jgi:uncharacterized protein YecA (UPF0149 family)